MHYVKEYNIIMIEDCLPTESLRDLRDCAFFYAGEFGSVKRGILMMDNNHTETPVAIKTLKGSYS